MNAITGFAGEEPFSSAPAPAREFTLRRTGRKSVRFSGWQLVEAKGCGEGDAIWYDLAMYRSDADAIIVELIARRGLAGEQDVSRVESFADVQEAASWLEAYSVGNDVPIPPALSAEDGPVALAVLKAIQLRQRLARIQDDYDGLLSDVFAALDIADTPQVQPAACEHGACSEAEA